MTPFEARNLIEIYGRAWTTRDPDLILTIFTEDATYNDPSLPENQGHEGIRAYWISKVVGEQKDIDFKLRNLWVDGDTVIAEWDATFTDVKRNLHIEMSEVAIFGVRDGKFSSLREYYEAKKTPL
jgi:ketosteroid isomerase-like protein